MKGGHEGGAWRGGHGGGGQGADIPVGHVLYWQTLPSYPALQVQVLVSLLHVPDGADPSAAATRQ
jgi:hypothetical protein